MVIVMALISAATPPAPSPFFTAELFRWLVGAVLSAGSVGAYLTYRVQKRKAPVEIDSIAIQGAETAVLAMQKVYDAEVAAHERTRADRDRLQREVDEQREEIKGLQAEIGVLKAALSTFERRLERLAHSAGVDTDPHGIPAVAPTGP